MITPRWQTGVLAVSLLVNLFLAGVVAGAWWPRAPAPAQEGRGGMMGGMRPQMAAMQQTRQQVRTLLAAPELDVPALELALAELREKTRASQEAAHRDLVAKAQQLSPEQRQNLLHSPRHGRGR